MSEQNQAAELAADAIGAITMIAKAAIGAVQELASEGKTAAAAPSPWSPDWLAAEKSSLAAASADPAAGETIAPQDETDPAATGDDQTTNQAEEAAPAAPAGGSPNDIVRAMTGGAPVPVPPASGPNSTIAVAAAGGTAPTSEDLDAVAAEQSAADATSETAQTS